MRGPSWSPFRGPSTGCTTPRGRPGATSAGRRGTSGGTALWPGSEELLGPPSPGTAPALSSPAPLAARYPEPPLLLLSPSLLPLGPQGVVLQGALMSGRAPPPLPALWRGLWRRVRQGYFRAWERALPRGTHPSFLLFHQCLSQPPNRLPCPLTQSLLTSPQAMPWRAGPGWRVSGVSGRLGLNSCLLPWKPPVRPGRGPQAPSLPPCPRGYPICR